MIGAYVLRRLGWSVLTIFGVMVLTFYLFRVVGGDIASSWVGQKASRRQRIEWEHRHGYDRPLWVNVHSRLVVLDQAGGEEPLDVAEASKGTQALEALALVLPTREEIGELGLQKEEPAAQTATRPAKALESQQMVRALVGRFVSRLDRQTPVVAPKSRISLTGGMPLRPQPKGFGTAATSAPSADGPILLAFSLSDGSKIVVDLDGVQTAGDILDRINNHADNRGRLKAMISDWEWNDLLRSQFFHHLYVSASFQSVSLADGRTLTTIISDCMGFSLSIMVPAMAIGWFLDLIIASLVAYYRGSVADRVGVFLAVLGMCIPILAFMMVGQQIMFALYPEHAYGIAHRVNVYLPVAILIIAGMGASVRFYRTVILDETQRDYVRTAKAKGVPLPNILFKHVLKNCMLPILTSLVMAIPFLIMGNLLLETYFGIPGLGDVLYTSWNERNEPILNGLVFLSSVMYTVSVLITDLSYAVFDPRIRLQ